MNCPHCQETVPDGSRFCHVCGKPIPTYRIEWGHAPQSAIEANFELRKNARTFVITGATALVVGLVLLVVVTLGVGAIATEPLPRVGNQIYAEPCTWSWQTTMVAPGNCARIQALLGMPQVLAWLVIVIGLGCLILSAMLRTARAVPR